MLELIGILALAIGGFFLFAKIFLKYNDYEVPVKIAKPKATKTKKHKKASWILEYDYEKNEAQKMADAQMGIVNEYYMIFN